MKRFAWMLALLLPVAAQAQTFAGRASVGVDYKIKKGLHLVAEEEVRSAEGFSALGSTRTTLGITWKPASFLKLGTGYTLINPWKVDKEVELEDGSTDTYTGFWAPRHRFYADVRGDLHLGDFSFFLKERLQLTHNGDSGMNIYQNPRNALALKSRIGVKYKGWRQVEPSLYFEVRTQMNGAWGTMSGSEQTTKSGKSYYAFTPTGYTHFYNDRYRGQLGLDWNITKQHVLSPYVLLDYVSEYDIDTNSKGTRLFSAAYNEYFGISVGLSYVFKF
ncbi:MAG: DUF2490 domain-containing protein [Bacteroidales bacterium]|nr:DUF2490 domain-containing protein [Bacteroidales bacterium]